MDGLGLDALKNEHIHSNYGVPIHRKQPAAGVVLSLLTSGLLHLSSRFSHAKHSRSSVTWLLFFLDNYFEKLFIFSQWRNWQLPAASSASQSRKTIDFLCLGVRFWRSVFCGCEGQCVRGRHGRRCRKCGPHPRMETVRRRPVVAFSLSSLFRGVLPKCFHNWAARCGAPSATWGGPGQWLARGQGWCWSSWGLACRHPYSVTGGVLSVSYQTTVWQTGCPLECVHHPSGRHGPANVDVFASVE